MKAWLLLAFLVIAGLLLFFRNDVELLSGLGTTEIIILAGGVLLIGFYLLSILADERARPLRAVGYLLIWALIALALVAGYSYREDLGQIASRVGVELAPAGQTFAVQTDEGERAVRVRRRLDGHYAVRGTVNGQPMTLLVDTGASTVVLKPAEAERVGIDTAKLSYTVAVNTANGMTYAAPVRIQTLAIGSLVVRNVEALVAKPGSVNENLLGMSFLRRLRSYEFSKDYLTLRG
jgi:aspartyl protease family protein